HVEREEVDVALRRREAAPEVPLDRRAVRDRRRLRGLVVRLALPAVERLGGVVPPGGGGSGSGDGDEGRGGEQAPAATPQPPLVRLDLVARGDGGRVGAVLDDAGTVRAHRPDRRRVERL